MLRKVLILTAVVSVLLACRLQAAVINSNWVGGSQGEWENATHWNPASIPQNGGGNTFAVTINAGVDEVAVGLQQGHSIDRLDCYGEVELNKWTVNWVQLVLEDANGLNGLTNHGNLAIEEIMINGNVNNAAGAFLELYHMDIQGNLYNQVGGEIEVGNEVEIGNDQTEIGGIYNNGRIVIDLISCLWVNNGDLHNSGSIEIYGGECMADDILDNNSAGIIKGFGVIGAEEWTANAGQIVAEGGSLAIVIENSGLVNTGLLQNNPTSSLQIRPRTGLDLNNVGTIIAHAGGGIALDCNLVNEANGVIELLGGTLAATSITQSPDANFTGFGSITGNIAINPNAVIRLTGPTNIVGDVEVKDDAALEISDGQTLITGHTVCDGTIHLIGGTVIFQGGCDCGDCNIINEAGIDRNHFDINADGIENFKDFAEFADNWLWKASWY